MNVVMTGSGRFVEVQGTAEGLAFTRGELDELLDLAEGGIDRDRRRCRTRRVGHRPPSPRSSEAGPGHGQPRQGGGDRRDPRRRRSSWRPARPTCPTSSRTATRSRTTPGSRPWPSREATGGLPVADDTGLEVDALGGAPGRPLGPLRRRGRHRRRQRGQAARRPGRACRTAERSARFRTVALVRWPDGREVVAEGVVEGRIADRAARRRRLRLRPASSSPPTATAAPSPRWPPTRSTPSATAAGPSAPSPQPPGRRPELGLRADAMTATGPAGAAHQPRRSTGHLSTTSSPRTTWKRSCRAMVGSTWAGDDPHPVADRRRRPVGGTNVMCSSEQYQTSAPVDGRVAVVHASDLSPASATAAPGLDRRSRSTPR